MLAFVVRREPEYDYRRASHMQSENISEETTFYPVYDPPKDSDFDAQRTVAGDLAHRHPVVELNYYQSVRQWSNWGEMGLDDFIDTNAAHPLQQQHGAMTPYGAQTPYVERFNNSGLSDPTTSYNTIIDKIVAGIKARREGR